MTGPARFCCAALLLLLAALCTDRGWAQSPERQGLGLCPPNASRLDGYMQALCDGEAALQAGDFSKAIEHFRFAAALPRVDASNELAWAGLAAAHCQSREVEAGRQWAAHFAQARQLWLGELDCVASGEDPRARLSPFVRSRMCTEQLAVDYATVRSNPQTAHALDLRARLKQIDGALAASCNATPAAQAQASGKTSNEDGKKKASKKRSSRTVNKPKNG
jgi:hypothetical protein